MKHAILAIALTFSASGNNMEAARWRDGWCETQCVRKTQGHFFCQPTRPQCWGDRESLSDTGERRKWW